MDSRLFEMSVDNRSKYYTVTSQLTGLSLQAEGVQGRGRGKVTAARRSSKDDQAWYDHPETGTIRNKFNGHCLDVENHQFVLRPYEKGRQEQQWERRTHVIVSRDSKRETLNATNSIWRMPTKIFKHVFCGTKDQLWNFEFLPREFYIENTKNQKVVSIKNESKDIGAEVIACARKPSKSRSQLWCLDEQGYIHSALNDLVFSAENGKHATMVPFSDDIHCRWKFDPKDESIIRSEAGDVLDIEGCLDQDGSAVIAFEKKLNSDDDWNQRWKQEPE